jgi:release factor glutamine methyltransferase
MSLATVLADHTARLARAGVPSPGVDAELLAAHVTGLSRGELVAHSHKDFELSGEQAQALEDLVARRELREPLQHLVGSAPFMSFEVAVGPGVFVPRPETESLAERAIEAGISMALGEEGLRVIDLCAGSGVLAIALARGIRHARVSAVELSDAALPYLQRNISDLAPEITLLHTSVEEWAISVGDEEYDLIVSNPPYVPEAEVPNDPEVQKFDPPMALYAGEDGLDTVRVIIQAAARAVRRGGVLMVEHSNLQGEAVRDVFRAHDFRTVLTHQDLVGRDRFTQGYRP